MAVPQYPAAPGAARRVLVVAGMHGDELASASLALHWIALAQKAGQPVHWRFIPVLKPDGLLAARPTRRDPRCWPGPAPLSGSESQFLHAQMEAFLPQRVVSIHAPYGVLDFDGPHDPTQRLDRVGVFPVSFGPYGGVQQGMPVVTTELDHALRLPLGQEKKRVCPLMNKRQ